MKLILDLPNSVEITETEIKRLVAAKLYEAGKLSLGQAAELAGMQKLSFAEILSQYDVSIINHPIAEIIRDAKAI